VSGPAHAGAFGSNALDATFGPKVEFVHAPPVANTSPADGYQHFGEVRIDAATGAFRVDLRDREGVSLWSTTLAAPH
jgi:alkaline phosphatase D